MKYWYLIWIGECPLCGRDKGYRERQYTPRPENREDRYKLIPQSSCYDWCDVER